MSPRNAEGAGETRLNAQPGPKSGREKNENETDAEEKEDGIASAIPGEREGLMAIKIDDIKTKAKRPAADLVEEQVKQARLSATLQTVGDEEAKNIAWQVMQTGKTE